MSDWRVIQGDCLDVMAGMDPASVDSIVSDPPYGLSFMGKGWDHAVPGVPFWEAALRVAKPGAYLVAFGGTRTYHRLTCAIEDAGWEIRDCLSWLYGSGFPKSHNGPWGGTALKPGWEPIILARKPLIGTVAANVAEHGTGGLNIDGCRLGSSGGYTNHTRLGGESGNWTGNVATGERTENGGRWPANVALDEAAAAMLDEQSGERKAGVAVQRNGGGQRIGSDRTLSGYDGDLTRPDVGYGDSGGASRFFYCAKASRAERERGLEGMERNGKRVVMASGGRTQVDGQWVETGSVPVPRTNHHPTVKPIALMRWLCRLVTPAGGLVLDPFAGSGTTGCAAVAEGFRFIGAELNGEYALIAGRRIAAAVPEPTLEVAA